MDYDAIIVSDKGEYDWVIGEEVDLPEGRFQVDAIEERGERIEYRFSKLAI